MSTGRWVLTAIMFVAFPISTILGGEERTAPAAALALQGRRLSAEEAQALEKQLEANPGDLGLRTQLLGYYWSKSFLWSKKDREAKHKHVLWVIENRPGAEIAGQPFASLDPHLDWQVYPKGKAAWLKQAEKFEEDAQVLGNAAAFFLIPERRLAESFLQKAQSRAPNNPDWAERLGQVYQLDTQAARDAEDKQEAAAKALKCFEDALKATKRESKRRYLLVDAASSSFDAGETKKAEAYATELLANSSSNERSGSAGMAIHHGNLILGRLALKAGDIEKAKKRLIAAGKTPGASTLRSFGPNMALAKGLLEKGETEVVLEYFELCSRFWEDKRGQLKKWTKEIKKGRVPDFGANLVY